MKTKHEVNLENWEFVRPLTEEEFYKTHNSKYYPSVRGWYKCKKCGDLKDISNSKFKCKVSKCKCVEKEPTGIWKENLERWSEGRKLSLEDYENEGIKKRKGRSWYKCNVCGLEKAIDRFAFKTTTYVCNNGCHGVGKSTSFVIKGVNDLATEYPELVKYFVDKELPTKLRSKSTQVVQLQCPHCGFKKETRPCDIHRKGFRCPICSDGISYPEKIVGNFLKVLNIEFKTQICIANKYRYDFYIPSLNAIVEVHGLQHYPGQRPKHWKTYEKEHENDIDKWMLANVKFGEGLKYIVLDCRYSELDWIKKSIVNSELSTLFDLSEIDWLELHSKSECSRALEVIEYYNENGGTLAQIGDKFGISDVSVGRYLRKGCNLGLCNYKSKKQHDKGSVGKAVVLIMDNKIEGFYSSGLECSRATGINYTGIVRMSKGENGTHFTNNRKVGKIGVYYLNSKEWEEVRHLYE